VIVKGRLIPFPGAVITLETTPTIESRDAITSVVRRVRPLLRVRRICAELERQVDGRSRYREIEIAVPATATELDPDAVAAWWTLAHQGDESLAALKIEEARYRIPEGIDTLDFGLTMQDRVEIPVQRDERGDGWIDPRDITLSTEAPVTVRMLAEHRVALAIHWSPWLVSGNPLSALFDHVIDGFVADGWAIASRSEHWTADMLGHYRE